MNEKIMRMHYETTPKEILIDILVSARLEFNKLQNRNKEYKQEIERLNNNWNKLKKWIEEYRNETGLSEYETGISDALYDTLKKMKALQELKGDDNNGVKK